MATIKAASIHTDKLDQAKRKVKKTTTMEKKIKSQIGQEKGVLEKKQGLSKDLEKPTLLQGKL